jgi:hypothetical protein
MVAHLLNFEAAVKANADAVSELDAAGKQGFSPA